MDTDNRVVKACGGVGLGWRRAMAGERGMSVITSAIKIFLKEWARQKESPQEEGWVVIRKEEEEENEKNVVWSGEGRVPVRMDLGYSEMPMDSKSSLYWLVFWNSMPLFLEIITNPKVYPIF